MYLDLVANKIKVLDSFFKIKSCHSENLLSYPLSAEQG
jgi:hypothetical protein